MSPDGVGGARVFVVDDDSSVRKSLSRLLRATGYQVMTFSSAEEFLVCGATGTVEPCCVVLDVNLPDTSGLELQKRLMDRARSMPIVFITGRGSIPMGVQAMRDGAVDFLPKPFLAEDLVRSVESAIRRDEEQLSRLRDVDSARKVLAELTPREHEVFRWVLTGLLNKQIAARLGIAEKTVKVHRGRVMQKTGLYSVAELVRLAERAGIPPAE